MASQRERLLRMDGLLHRMPPERLTMLQGEVLSLYMASPRHLVGSIDEFASAVLPPIHFDQFRIYHEGKRPVGWVTWAFLTDAEAQGFMAGDFDFDIGTWTGGPHLWFMDFIAPFGHASGIAEDLRRNVFPDRVGFAPDLESPDGAKRIRKFFGARVKGADMREDHRRFIEQIAR